MTVGPPISFRDGRLYISFAASERYFAGSGSVALLRDGADLLVLPVRHAAAGGYILKMRNSAGDQVVTAPAFFDAQGATNTVGWSGAMSWREDRGALALHDFFSAR